MREREGRHHLDDIRERDEGFDAGAAEPQERHDVGDAVGRRGAVAEDEVSLGGDGYACPFQLVGVGGELEDGGDLGVPGELGVVDGVAVVGADEEVGASGERAVEELGLVDRVDTLAQRVEREVAAVEQVLGASRRVAGELEETAACGGVVAAEAAEVGLAEVSLVGGAELGGAFEHRVRVDRQGGDASETGIEGSQQRKLARRGDGDVARADEGTPVEDAHAGSVSGVSDSRPRRRPACTTRLSGVLSPRR